MSVVRCVEVTAVEVACVECGCMYVAYKEDHVQHTNEPRSSEGSSESRVSGIAAIARERATMNAFPVARAATMLHHKHG